jgi:hypothetical protein
MTHVDSARKRAWRAANPEKDREANKLQKRKWRAKNPPKPVSAEKKAQYYATRAANMRKWRAENPEKAKALWRKKNAKRALDPGWKTKHAADMRAFRKKHPEKERAVQDRYREKPGVREMKLKASRAWYKANPGKKEASDKAWRDANPERVRVNSNRHSQKCRDELRNSYVSQLLGGRDVATPEMIEVKRLHIKIHRLLGEKR